MPQMPSLPAPPPNTPLLDDAAIVERIAALLGDFPATGRTLWTFFLDAERVQLPLLLPLDDLPTRPVPTLARSLLDVLARTLANDDAGGGVVLTLERPGPVRISDADREWCRLLSAAAGTFDVMVHGIYLAVSGRVSRLS